MAVVYNNRGYDVIYMSYSDQISGINKLQFIRVFAIIFEWVVWSADEKLNPKQAQ